MNALAAQYHDRYGLTVQVDAQPEAEPETADAVAFLYGFARELLFNVVRHAHIDEAAVLLRAGGDGTVTLAVRVQGVGFDPAAVELQRGTPTFGLFSLRERALAMGGRLELTGSPAGGCLVEVRVPRGAVGPRRQ